ncbi:MAG: Arm DNA-binding domain-containing protein [Xanthobacteraceae bacterium]|nr:Arm DNA-binding domain-containing protein [Xanthobacteraceae bacterium]
MAKPKAGTNITQATVEAAQKDAAKGVSWEHPDPGCAGLSLRVAGTVTWSFRGPRLAGKNRRWTVGDHTVDRETARDRAHEVRRLIRSGLDPSGRLREMITGIVEERQAEVRVVAKPSWKWERAIDEFEKHLKGAKRRATVDDYIPTLRNADVLQRFKGRDVCDVTRSDIMKAVDAKRLQGTRTHHKKILVVTRRFFDFLAQDVRRDETSVQPDLLTTAKAGDPLLVTRRVRQNKGIPEAEPIGRALAIARTGVLGDAASDAIQILLGTLQRRHAVCAVLGRAVRPYHEAGQDADGRPLEFVWFVPPAHRKTADKIQSSEPH